VTLIGLPCQFLPGGSQIKVESGCLVFALGDPSVEVEQVEEESDQLHSVGAIVAV
jgi:hypothetical protein